MSYVNSAIISLNKVLLVSIVCVLVLLPILGLFTNRFNGYGISEDKKNNFPTDRPILEKQGRVRGNKNIFKVGLRVSKS